MPALLEIVAAIRLREVISTEWLMGLRLHGLQASVADGYLAVAVARP